MVENAKASLIVPLSKIAILKMAIEAMPIALQNDVGFPAYI